jgi:2-methylisocitrate lyase-like PEP mutase family enzyme
MTFADLHHRDQVLLLPNAWDLPSALAFAAAGFEAIGTTSFGVAASIGRPDGGRATKEANAVLARQLAPLPVYVSIDIEDGYTDDPDEVAAYVAELGVAGINIEDSTDGSLIPPEAHAAKVAAIRRAQPDLFINARVDTYWFDQDATVDATRERAATYVAAGADGIFVPGVSEPDTLRGLAEAIAVPLNVLVVPGLSLDDLGRLGVRRVSTGSLPYRAAMHTALEVATAVRDGRAVPSATPYPELQARLVEYDREHPDQASTRHVQADDGSRSHTT